MYHSKFAEISSKRKFATAKFLNSENSHLRNFARANIRSCEISTKRNFAGSGAGVVMKTFCSDRFKPLARVIYLV